MSSEEILWRGIIMLAIAMWGLYRWLRVPPEQRSKANLEEAWYQRADDSESPDRPPEGP